MQTAAQLYEEGQKLLFGGDKEGAFSKFSLAAAMGSEEAKLMLSSVYGFDTSVFGTPKAVSGSAQSGAKKGSAPSAQQRPVPSAASHTPATSESKSGVSAGAVYSQSRSEHIDYDRDEFEIKGTTLVKYKGDGGDVEIPYGVVTIGDKAFWGTDGVTSVTIPSSVTSIGEEAFSDCFELKSITMNNGIKSIGGGAFNCCSDLASVTIPSSVTSIGDGAFFGTNLRSVTIPSSVLSFGKNMFGDCVSLEVVRIPAKFKGIDLDLSYDPIKVIYY